MESNTKEKDLYVELPSYRGIYENYELRCKADEIFEKTKDLKAVEDFCKRELKKPIIAKLKRESEIIRRFQDSTFKNFIVKDKIQEKALKQAKHYVENIQKFLKDGTNIIICGERHCGTGKSRLASTITNELLNDCIAAKFISSTKMINKIKQNFDTTEYTNTEILTIDDLGKERNTEWVSEQIFAIFNSRYEEVKPIIITTEGSIDDLLNHYKEKGNAMIGRIIEKAIIIILDGKDYRWIRQKP